jgi:hypothetical protein
MTEGPQVTWTCPLCRGVIGDEPWVSATEGLFANGFTPDPRELSDDNIVWGPPVRFHEGHFRQRIDARVYRLARSPSAGVVRSD